VLDRETIDALMKQLKLRYDILIFDSAATVLGNESLLLYTLVDHIIYLYRAKFTGIKYAQQAEMLAEEYGWKNIHLILNGVHPATNFSGYYTGSRYSYEYNKGNLLDKIRHYLKIYL
jgi:CO dehydrogenase nickel-insertion accessory protein CooC1